MGGSGSGRLYVIGAKETVEDYLQIDIRRWNRESLLDVGRRFTWIWTSPRGDRATISVASHRGYVQLNYRQQRPGQEWETRDYPVDISYTPCHLGGARPWFLCPYAVCNRRVAKLYCSNYFSCRNRLDLAYPRQREEAYNRAARKANQS